MYTNSARCIPFISSECPGQVRFREQVMVDAVDEIFKEPEVKKGRQFLRSHNKYGSGQFYNFLAGIFMAGTFVAG